MRDLRYAIRTLARTPAFTSTVVLTIALGIGANAAVFAVVSAVLLEPPAFPHGERLMVLRQTQERSGETNIAPIRLEDWNRSNASFDAITGYYVEDASETSGELPERVRRAFVAPRFLDVWGLAPQIGRGFRDDEHAAGAPPAAIISDGYWRRRFGADPAIMSRTLRIGGGSFPIVGVMPSSFLFPDRRVDMWLPVAMAPWLAQARQASWYQGVGRLRAGVTVDQARADLSRVQSRLAERYPDTDRGIAPTVAPLKDVAIGGLRASLWTVYGAVCLLLVITCTNVAALLVSRAAHRQHEIGVRVSLGASGAAIAVQALTESAVLAAIGGVAGLGLGAAAVRALGAAALDLPRMDEVVVNGRVVFYTAATTSVVALLCGLLPALRSAQTPPASAGTRVGVSRNSRLQWLLVGTQVALSVALLAIGALFARSLEALSRVNPGFEPRRVLTFRLSGSWAETTNYERLVSRIDKAIEALRTLPGVENAATGIFLPGVPAMYEWTFDLVEGQDSTAARMQAESRFVSPEYFATLQVPVLDGANCGRGRLSAPRDLMVNRAFANRYLSRWPSALGLHLSTAASSGPPGRIVGIVGDARERGLDREPGPVVYSCFSAPNPTPYFFVRTRGEPEAIVPAVRARLKEVDPSRAVYDVARLDDRIGGAFSENRLRTLLLSSFAASAFLLACVGLYGTLNYVVALRRREIGLRLALGAMRGSIVRQFVVHALRVVVAACAIGVALALASAKLLSGMLFGVSASDPATLAGVVTFVIGVTTVAALLPATRAAQVSPITALREE
jgi:putative ABC transport system permease protein